MKYNEETLWQDFRKSMEQTLKDIGFQKLHNSFEERTKFTDFNKHVLWKKIADSLKLRYSEEYLTVDGVFWDSTETEARNWDFPIVYLESEWDIKSIDQGANGDELSKLCYFNALLKLIFVWEEGWEQSTMDRYVDGWQSTIDAFKKVNNHIGYLGIIVETEETDKFKFHSNIWDNSGIMKEEPIICIPK
jgi:hypothetical protein